MKILFASDLHGSLAAAEAVLARMDAEKADRLILLGDLLYHGPRNPLPERYDPMAVATLFNAMPVKPLPCAATATPKSTRWCWSFR